jgi:4'-phosphopantetheinyl transferase
VHWFDIERCAVELENGAAALSHDENERASRYRFAQDRRRYMLVRAALRHQLGAYLDTTPAKIKFTYNDAGKPQFTRDRDDCRLNFNVSHSRNLALIAVSRGCRVGVDVEYMKSDLEFEALARHSFSEYERRALQALKGDDQVAAFYRCWTRKEAYIKAIGDGISYGLDRFDVSLDSAETRVVADRKFDGELRWKYTNLSLKSDFAAVVIADEPDYELEIEELRQTTIFR